MELLYAKVKARMTFKNSRGLGCTIYGFGRTDSADF